MVKETGDQKNVEDVCSFRAKTLDHILLVVNERLHGSFKNCFHLYNVKLEKVLSLDVELHYMRFRRGSESVNGNHIGFFCLDDLICRKRLFYKELQLLRRAEMIMRM